MRKMILLVSALLVSAASFAAFSHSGGTDAYGCHNDHKTGGYHCH